MMRAIVGFIASALVFSVGARAARAEKPKKVVIEQFSGGSADQFKKLVVSALSKQGIEVISDKKRAATEADLGLLQVSDNYPAVAKELGAGAFIDGTVTGSKNLTARLKVKGPDGAALGQASWTGGNAKKLLRSIDDTVAKKLAGLWGAEAAAPVAAAAPAKEEAAEEPKPRKKRAAAAEEEEKPAAAAEEGGTVTASAEEEEEDEPSGPPSPHPSLDLAVGAHVYGRNFKYNKSLQGGQQAYNLPAVPAPTIFLDYFVTRNIGLSAGFEYSMALISEDKPGFRYATSSMGYTVGGKYRHYLGNTELIGGLAYAVNNFKITPESTDLTPPQVAAVEYKQIKAGVDVRLPFGDKFALVGGGSYLHLLGVGELRDVYFPGATGRGGVGHAGFAFGLPWMKGMEARVVGDFRRYVFAMNSIKSDARIAGGATDQYIGVNLLVGLRR